MQIHYKYTPNVAHISIFQLKVNLTALLPSLVLLCLPWITDWQGHGLFIH